MEQFSLSFLPERRIYSLRELSDGIRGMLEAQFANIWEGLAHHGFSDGDVAKIMGGNFMRLFRDSLSEAKATDAAREAAR